MKTNEKYLNLTTYFKFSIRNQRTTFDLVLSQRLGNDLQHVLPLTQHNAKMNYSEQEYGDH